MSSRNESPVWAAALVRPILIGVSASVICCLVLLLGAAYGASIMDIPQALVVPLAMVIVAISTFLGAFIGAKISGRNGWLIGLAVAVALFLVSIIAGIGLFGHLNAGVILIKACIMAATGLVGGVVSVNSGVRKRNR